jgi:hypothetical protein
MHPSGIVSFSGGVAHSNNCILSRCSKLVVRELYPKNKMSLSPAKISDFALGEAPELPAGDGYCAAVLAALAPGAHPSIGLAHLLSAPLVIAHGLSPQCRDRSR